MSPQGQVSVTCVAGRTEENNRPYVNLTVSEGFGFEGIEKEQDIKLQISSLINPRAQLYKSEFFLYTMDR